jgi:hypothetical protein
MSRRRLSVEAFTLVLSFSLLVVLAAAFAAWALTDERPPRPPYVVSVISCAGVALTDPCAITVRNSDGSLSPGFTNGRATLGDHVRCSGVGRCDVLATSEANP